MTHEEPNPDTVGAAVLIMLVILMILILVL